MVKIHEYQIIRVVTVRENIVAYMRFNRSYFQWSLLYTVMLENRTQRRFNVQMFEILYDAYAIVIQF